MPKERLIDANGIQYTSFLKENWLENTSVEVEAVLRDEIDNMPTVEAIPIEFVKGELKHLKYMLLTADSDDVDSIWDLKAKIEALEDLLKEWEEKNETD